jgi:hypothetical protein
MKYYIKELLGVTLFIIIPVVLVIAITKFPSQYLDMGPADGPPHNYWVPPYDDTTYSNYYDTIELKPEDFIDLDSIEEYDRREMEMLDEMEKRQDTINKEEKDWTGTTQGERTNEELLSIEPDYIYYDTPQTYKNK